MASEIFLFLYRSDKIMSRGQEETSALQANIEQQVARLVLQLAELEEAKDELDAEEYAECREDTIQQLEDFNKTLSGMKEGSVSLVNEINAAQLAIRAAISQVRFFESILHFADAGACNL